MAKRLQAQVEQASKEGVEVKVFDFKVAYTYWPQGISKGGSPSSTIAS